MVWLGQVCDTSLIEQSTLGTHNADFFCYSIIALPVTIKPSSNKTKIRLKIRGCHVLQ